MLTVSASRQRNWERATRLRAHVRISAVTSLHGVAIFTHLVANDKDDAAATLDA